MQETQGLATRNGAPELVLMSKVYFDLLSESTFIKVGPERLQRSEALFAVCSAVEFFAMIFTRSQTDHTYIEHTSPVWQHVYHLYFWYSDFVSAPYEM